MGIAREKVIDTLFLPVYSGSLCRPIPPTFLRQIIPRLNFEHWKHVRIVLKGKGQSHPQQNIDFASSGAHV